MTGSGGDDSGSATASINLFTGNARSVQPLGDRKLELAEVKVTPFAPHVARNIEDAAGNLKWTYVERYSEVFLACSVVMVISSFVLCMWSHMCLDPEETGEVRTRAESTISLISGSGATTGSGGGAGSGGGGTPTTLNVEANLQDTKIEE